MKHKRIEIDWKARQISVFVNQHPTNVIPFSGAIHQRKVVIAWLAHLDRKRFEMTAPTSAGAWVYEGMVTA